MLHLVGWHEPRVVLPYSQPVGHITSHLVAVASKHHNTLYSNGFERCNSLLAIVLNLVIDNDVPCIVAIDCHMNDGTHMWAVIPFCTDSIHHASVAHVHHITSNCGTYSLACNLLDIGHCATIGCLVGEGVAQRSTYGMSREMLYMGGEMQQLMLIAGARMHSCYLKLTMGESSRLIKHHSSHLSECIDVISTLYENALA